MYIKPYPGEMVKYFTTSAEFFRYQMFLYNLYWTRGRGRVSSYPHFVEKRAHRFTVIFIAHVWFEPFDVFQYLKIKFKAKTNYLQSSPNDSTPGGMIRNVLLGEVHFPVLSYTTSVRGQTEKCVIILSIINYYIRHCLSIWLYGY